MQRHYFIGISLDELEQVERQLELAGVTTPQIHVLSEDDAGLELHNLHQVEAVLKKDVVHGTELGAMVGVVAAACVLAVAWFSGLTATYTWVPAIFLAIIVLGFCTWEGGLIGIQKPHIDFRRFKGELENGKHILFVDIDPRQEEILHRVIKRHPTLQPAGEGAATPRYVIGAQQKWASFLKAAP
jgi:hypothetical protein